uniref:Complement C8 alpha chain n=1 Tax=Fundulus heteroclitus TaxID=8078 RepID=A0A3Q2PID3_FUNHE
MVTFNHVALALCALHLFLNGSPTVSASRKPWTTANNRRARAATRPTPINCRMGSWSSWTPCDSCTDKTEFRACPTGTSEMSFFWNQAFLLCVQDLGFIRLWSKVKSAHFKMRSNQLMLHEDFYVALMELPEQYEFGAYSRFLNTFGTHYVTEGTMGGTLEYVAILNKRAMAESNIESERFQSCFGAALGITNPVSESATAGPLVCQSFKALWFVVIANSSESSVVEDIVTLVKGGITETGSGLLAIRSPETYRKWGASLKYNPALTDFEILPISEAVRSSTAAGHVGARIDNLERATDEYLQQFDPCQCAPCRHNGIPVFSGTTCSCVCKSGFRGMACEETLRRDCVGALWEKLACPRATTQCMVEDYCGESFTCKETGKSHQRSFRATRSLKSREVCVSP